MRESESEANQRYAKSFVKSSTILFAMSIVSNAIGLVLRVFLARSLNATDYGLFYAVFALVSMFGAFRDLGIGTYVVRSIPKYRAQKRFDLVKTSMNILMIVQASFSLVVALILISFSDTIALTIFGASGASLVIKGLSGWFFFESIYYTYRGAFQGLQDFQSLSLLSFFEIFLPFVFVISLVWIFGISSARVAFAYFGGLGITVLITFGLFFKKHQNVYRAKADSLSKSMWSEHFKFALPVLIGGITAAIIGQFSTVMLASLRSTAEAGYYQIAYPIANLLLYFPAAMGSVLFPLIAELWVKKKNELIKRAIHTIMKFSFIFIIPAALIFVAFPEIVISLLFGSEYLPASAALQILAITAVIQTIGVIANRVILGTARATAIAWITGATAALTALFNILLIPAYGVVGAAIATSLSSLASLALSLYVVRKHVRFTLPVSAIIKAIVGGLLTLLIVWELKSIIDLPVLPELFAVMVPGLLFYAAWVLLTRTLTLDDLVLLRTTIPGASWLVKLVKKFKPHKIR